jgi:tetratricopeptide (TPR) repeat protein
MEKYIIKRRRKKVDYKLTNPVRLYTEVIGDYIDNNLFDIAADKILLIAKSFNDVKYALDLIISYKLETLTTNKKKVFIQELIHKTYQTFDAINKYRGKYSDSQMERLTIFCNRFVNELNEMGEEYQEIGETEKTNNYIEYAVKISILNYEYFDYFLEQSHSINNIKEVIRLVKIELSRKPNSPFILSLLGIAFYKDYQLEEAESFLLKAHELEPQNDIILHKLGTIYHYRGQYDKMEEALLKAEKICPEDVNLIYLLSTLYIETKQYKEAEKILTRASKLHPSRPLIINNLGWLYLEIDDHKNAMKAFERGLMLSKFNYNIQSKMGHYYTTKNELDAAEHYYLNACEDMPKNPLLLLYLGRVYYLKRDYYKSKKRLEQANLIDPYHPVINCTLALNHFQLGNISKARQYIKIAYGLDPKNDIILHNYEVIIGHSGKPLILNQKIIEV